MVEQAHVNLVDLVDDGSFEIFESLGGLQQYTIKTGRYFPKENAYAGGVLKFLLREIHNTWQGRDGQSRGRSRGGRRNGRV